ncbi:MAG: carboxypeptidase-like regulatory domain-containing protein [Bacteroidales bacterium]|jgi:hypothetical protein|nr:carboxypeptidase-like regulatory domain-containing protein [Bacteroidales bacterium]
MVKLIRILGFIAFVTLLLIDTITAQQSRILIKGKILDENGNPFVGANVYIKKPLWGIASNVEGEFTFYLPRNYQTQYLFVSGVGYKTDSIWIEKSETLLEINMEQDIPMIGEVVVKPKLTEYDILRNAFNRIADNYPAKPVRYEVFYRETNKTAEGEYVAVGEAMLDVFKNSYSKSNNKGQIRIEKSRKNIIPQYDSIVYMYFYGGVYAYIARDYIFTRAGVINPSNFRKFTYQLSGTTRYEGRDVYIIDFSSKKEDLSGKLYISANDYAYVRIEVATSQIIPGSGFERTNISDVIQYMPYDGKWHLQQIKYTDRKHIHSTGMVFDCSVEHLTVHANVDSAKSIPSRQRISYLDPFYSVAEDYNPNYWDGYNILQQDSTLRQVVESIHTIDEINRVMTSAYEKQQVDKLLAEVRENQERNLIMVTRDKKSNTTKRQINWNQFYKKIYGGIGLHYASATSAAGQYRFTYDNHLFFQQDRKSQRLDYGMDILLGVNMTDHWSIYWTGTGNPFNSTIRMMDNRIGTEYRFNMKKQGEPMYLGITADIGWGHAYALFGKTENTLGSFSADGKTFDTKHISVSGGLQHALIAPGISFAGKINKMFEISLYAKYNLQLTQRKTTVIREKDGFFLSRKRAAIDEHYIRATGNDGNPINGYIEWLPFQAGVMLTFR